MELKPCTKSVDIYDEVHDKRVLEFCDLFCSVLRERLAEDDERWQSCVGEGEKV